jgi:hypothetical protein
LRSSENGLTLRALCVDAEMTRQAVSKHPIQAIHERWIAKVDSAQRVCTQRADARRRPADGHTDGLDRRAYGMAGGGWSFILGNLETFLKTGAVMPIPEKVLAAYR